MAPLSSSAMLGGNGRQENAELTFQLVDVAGNGVADADVCFDATTYVGGLNLDGFSPSKLPAVQGSGALCGDTSDKLSIVRYVKRTGADGKVAVQINSGNTPTPVRLRARTLYPASTVSALETYSDTLSISTGLPLQRSFSLSIDKANIDGGNFDGETATLTVRLADQFSNPVPDGTVVNFVASGGAVCTADNGSCKTLNGACSCTFVSQARRPLSNRVVVLAYAVGLEDYNDNNGNNQYDLVGDTFFDLGDAYVDSNMDGIADSRTVNGDTDILIPYQKSGQFSAAGDGVRGTAHIRASTVIYLSQASGAGDPTAVVPLTELSQESDLLAGGSLSSYFVRLTPNCPAGTVLPQATVGFTLDDGIGNPMASGTTLIAADLSDNLSTTGIRPGTVLKVGTRPPVTSIDQPNGPKLSPWTTANANGTVVTGHTVTVRGVVEKCIGDASFVLELASPRGIPASARVLYENEARRVARGRFDVRYRNSGLSFTVSLQARTAFIDMAALVNAAGAQEVTSYTIEWGDGKPVIGNGPGISSGDRTHLYLEAGQKTVTLTVFAAGRSYSARQVLIVQ